jgi:peptidyl-prolyl cis-trans isomerase C
MSCSLHDSLLPKGHGVRVNGVRIARDVIAQEVQQHPARTPIEAWTAAARALVVRELLLQEARRLAIPAEPRSDDAGRRETDEDAQIRALVEREVRVPDPDEATCRRFYEQNRRRFRSADIYEAAHILFAAARADQESYARARKDAEAVLAALHDAPERFGELAQAHSACPSAQQGGNLGQITEGQTTPEFEAALLDMTPGSICEAPVETRYGIHIVRLDRKIEGNELPFELVADRIAAFLTESVHHRATAQYIARLASAAEIEGVTLAGADDLRVH